MKILIVEDEPIYVDHLVNLCEDLGYQVLTPCSNAFTALDSFHRNQPDLLLLDINLEGETDGIQLAEQINQKQTVPVIFITSLRDEENFARAQAAAPAAYILKPFDQLQLQRSIELAVSQVNTSAADHDFGETDLLYTDCIYIRAQSRLEKVQLADILYLSADGRYSMVHTVAGKKYALRIPLSELESRLPVEQFLRSHRSFLINLSWLESLELSEMILKIKGQEIPLGKSYKEAVLAKIDRW